MSCQIEGVQLIGYGVWLVSDAGQGATPIDTWVSSTSSTPTAHKRASSQGSSCQIEGVQLINCGVWLAVQEEAKSIDA